MGVGQPGWPSVGGSRDGNGREFAVAPNGGSQGGGMVEDEHG